MQIFSLIYVTHYYRFLIREKKSISNLQIKITLHDHPKTPSCINKACLIWIL